MVNINFHRKDERAESEKKKKVAINSSFLISILILVVSFSILFGLKIWRSSTESEVNSIKDQINKELESLGEENINRVADFQRRVGELEVSLSENKNPQEIMAKVESLMIPGVVLTAYNYNSEEKILKLEAVCDSFKIIAEQILSLKSSSYFEDVRVPSTSRDEEGRINFSVESKMVFEKNI